MKRLLIFFLLLIIAFPGFCQQLAALRPQFGLHGALTFSSLRYEPEAPLDYMEPWVSRFSVGLASSFWLSEWFAIAPELNYNLRGYEIGVSDDLNTLHYRYKFNYIELPLLLRASLGRRIMKIYVNAGPSISYLLGGEEMAEVNGVKTRRDISSSDPKYNNFEIGGMFGGGLHFTTGAGDFLLGLRYYTAFRDLHQDDYVLPVYENRAFAPTDYRSRYLAISLLYYLPAKENELVVE